MSTISFLKENIKQNKLAYLYILPTFIVMTVVIVYPFIYNIIISFSNMNMAHVWDWKVTGFQQYSTIFGEIKALPEFSFSWDFLARLMTEPNLVGVFIKTVLWTGINLFFHTVIGVSLALLLNRPMRGRALFRALLILPWAVPQYISALTWRGMFQAEYGAVNLILTQFLHLGPVEWHSSPLGAFAGCLIANIWLGFPFMMIVALGGLQSIPNELYEAADIDGASWFQRLRNITLPLIKPVMVPAISLGIIWTFNNFNVIWLVSNGGRPSDSTHILVSYVYKAVFSSYRYAYAAALSIIIFGILLLISINFIRRSKGTEGVY